MKALWSPTRATAVIGLLLVYYAIRRWGLETAGLRQVAISLIWPASGFALAIVLKYGVRLWPLIFIASAASSWPTLAANAALALQRTGGLVLLSSASALEAAIAAVLIRYLAGGKFLARPGPFLKSTLVALPVSAAVSAVPFVLGSRLGGLVDIPFPVGLLKDWHGSAIADFAGMLAFTPPIRLWLDSPRLDMNRRQALELGAGIAGAALALAVDTPTRPLYLLLGVHLVMAVELPLKWVATMVSASSCCVLWLSGPTAGGPAAHYSDFLTRLTFLVALNLATYITALFWHQVREQREELEARVADRTLELERLNAHLSRLSNVDPLTDVWNRRYFTHRAERELERAARGGTSVGLLLLDLDLFKAINDRFGHPVGDRVLSATAARLQLDLRPTDVLARFGGEEFAVLLPDCDEALGVGVAERLRAAVGTSPVHDDGTAIEVTVSIGMAVCRPAEHPALQTDALLQSMLALADRRLYQAKRSGRNRVVWRDSADGTD